MKTTSGHDTSCECLHCMFIKNMHLVIDRKRPVIDKRLIHLSPVPRSRKSLFDLLINPRRLKAEGHNYEEDDLKIYFENKGRPSGDEDLDRARSVVNNENCGIVEAIDAIEKHQRHIQENVVDEKFRITKHWYTTDQNPNAPFPASFARRK